MEVHDVAGEQPPRLQHVQGLLRGWGFSRVVLQQDGALAGSNIWMLYATRD